MHVMQRFEATRGVPACALAVVLSWSAACGSVVPADDDAGADVEAEDDGADTVTDTQPPPDATGDTALDTQPPPDATGDTVLDTQPPPDATGDADVVEDPPGDEDGGDCLRTWYHDADGDGYTDLSDTVIGCEDPDGAGTEWVDTPTAGDCDDSDPDVHHGTACDDGRSCTEWDTCRDGTCAGYATSSCEDCESDCSGGCGEDGCCIDGCVGTCDDCEPGCSCDLTCDVAASCDVSCLAGSVCHLIDDGTNGAGTMTCEDAACRLDCNSVNGDCEVDCEGTSACALYCNSVTGECSLNCDPGAACLLSCNSVDGACTMSCDSPTDCGGGVHVCHRPCP
jgi:hypothetical protein